MTDGQRPTDDAGAGEPSPRHQRLLERAADLLLAAEVLPGPTAIADLSTLRDRARGRKQRRRLMIGAIPATAAAALGLFLVVSRPGHRGIPSPALSSSLSYVVEGTATVQADSIEATPPASRSASPGTAPGAGAGARLRFTDGTVIALDPGTRLRVPTRTASGANLILDHGRASFAVIHRPGADWHVATGPFIVDVTGTRFSLAWASPAQQLTLNLESGGVIVRGSAAGPRVAVRPGETLVASARDGRFTVTPTGQAAPAARTVIPTAPPESHAVDAAKSEPDDAARSPAPHSKLALASPTATGRRGSRRAGPGEGLAIPEGTERTTDHQARPDLQPPSIVTPSAPSLITGGGGVFCARERAEFGFEGAGPRVWVPTVYHMAISGPRPDTSHSWCGVGSVKLDMNFHEGGRRNFMGRLPNQSGQMVITLPHLIDFTDKTVSLHMFIDGPPDARVAAQLYVIHHGIWVNGPLVDHLVPRRWWTISHTFRAENPLTVGPPYPPAGTSRVTDCDRIALIVYSTGGPRVWSGAIYVDDVGWK